MNLPSRLTLTLVFTLLAGCTASDPLGLVAPSPTTTSVAAAPVVAPSEEPGLGGVYGGGEEAELLASSGGVPLSLLNHAVLQRTLATTICVAGYSKSVRPPSSYTEGLRARLLAAYGLAPGTPAELDHIVPLSVGGAPRFPNIYPELAAVAKTDDAQENRVHDLICTGRMKLAEGRRQLIDLKLSHGYRPEVKL